MKLKFNKNQSELLRRLDIYKDNDHYYSDDEIIEIEDKTSHHLQMYGIADNAEVNEIGILCESILDMLAE